MATRAKKKTVKKKTVKKKTAKKKASKKVAKKKPSNAARDVSTGPPPAFRGDVSVCPSCRAQSGDGLIEVDVNTIRHWMGFVDFRKPDTPKLDNKLIKKLNRKDFESYFLPLQFVGWHRITPQWEHVLSPQKKDQSNKWVFWAADIAPVASKHWGFDDLKKYLNRKRQHSGKSPGVVKLCGG